MTRRKITDAIRNDNPRPWSRRTAVIIWGGISIGVALKLAGVL